jgi:hypothetical protein
MKSHSEALLVTSQSQKMRLHFKDWCREKIGWVLEKMHSPAKIKEFEFVDPETNETVYLYTSRRYSVFCIGDRRFYFDRISGAFDGTSTTPDRVSGRVKFCD